MRKFSHLAFLIFLSFSLTNCQDDDNREAVASLLKDLAEEPQQFDINTDTVSTITGKKGTHLTIDPKNLELENGSEISEDLRVELLELTTKKELLLHNAQTVSNGNWLVSGGAYHIEIFSGNQKVRLKEGKTILAEFPQITEEPMELFYGNREENGAMNWQPTGEKFEEKKYRAFVVKDTVLLDEELTREYRVDKYFDLLLIEDRGYQSLSNLKETQNQDNDKFRDTLFISNDTLILYKNYDTFKPYKIPLMIDDSSNQTHLAVGKSLKKLFKQIANPAHEQKFKNLKLEDSLMYAQIEERRMKKQKRRNVLYQQIQVQKLGWINVDRFYPQNSDRFTLTIEDTDNLDVLYVVDRTQKTLMELSYYNNFEIDIPKDIEFEIIGFGFDENDEFFGVKKRVQLRQDRSITLKKIPLEGDQIESFIDF